MLRTIRLRNFAAGALALASVAMGAACEAPDSKEDLNPEGPPMIRQVLMSERVRVNTSTRVEIGQLAFGTHNASFFDDDDGEVLTGLATGGQEIRIILDELVRGNRLEEIACADGTYSRIPDGTTPTDVKNCAGPMDAIAESCKKVCLASDGTPVGILDANEDGAADSLRMIDYNPDDAVTELGVAVVCDGEVIPMDQNESFWTPSGNQTFPSNPVLGFRGLGPAIVLKPVADIGMRTGSSCELVFRDEVVDRDDNRVCAPAGGDINQDCADADTSAVGFSMEPLEVVTTIPEDGDTGVALNASGFILLAFNANVLQSSVDNGGVTLTANGAPVAITPTVQEDDKTAVVINLGADFEPDATYVLTATTQVTDLLGGALPAEQTFTWTTSPFELTSSSPSDGSADVEVDDSGNILLNFNAEIDEATLGQISMTADGNNVAITPVKDPNIGTRVTIDLGADFENAAEYIITIGTGFQSAAGASLGAETTVTFTTAAFALANSNPADAGVDIALAGGAISLTFTGNVNQATVAGNITLTADGNAVTLNGGDFTTTDKVVDIDTGGDFLATTEYILTITTGVENVDGVALDAETTVTWTTVTP